jgi:hypothetical protein
MLLYLDDKHDDFIACDCNRKTQGREVDEAPENARILTVC